MFNQYVVRVPRREQLRSYLQTRGVGTEVYYPLPLHLQPCFAGFAHQNADFPESDGAGAQALALPIYPELSEALQRQVVACIDDFYTAHP